MNWFFLFIIGCILFGCNDKKINSKKPNIILLMADDLGFDDLGINDNSLIETPNLDQLAMASAQFSNFSVNAVCAPTRASLLTGRHFLRTGVSHVHGGKDYINLNETLISEELKKMGYATGMWGKWHSGNTIGYRPWERGFDEAYMAKLYEHDNANGILNGSPIKHKGWTDSLVVDYALKFIKKTKSKPFFAYIPFLAPHIPLNAPERDRLKYEYKGLSSNFSKLYGMIGQLDRQIGRLMDELNNMQLLENTVVIFMSDNGPQFLDGSLTIEEMAQRNFSNRKGHKGNLWENGVKSPLFFMWKDHIAPNKLQRHTHVVDLFPTIMDLAGASINTDRKFKLDGRSLLPNMLECGEADKERPIFDFASLGWAPSKKNPYSLDGLPNEYKPLAKKDIEWETKTVSVKKGNYKLIQNPKNVDGYPELGKKFVLYNLYKDPEERIDISDKNTEEVHEMKTMIVKWQESIVKEPHAFASPIFIIEPDVLSTINATGVARHSEEIKNTVLELKGWKTSGNWAEFNIEVKKEGDYELILDYDRSGQFTNGHFLIESNSSKNKTILKLGAGHSSGLLHLKRTDKKIKLTFGNMSSPNVYSAEIGLKEIRLIRKKV